jgi:hypothetical protein
VGVDGSVGVDGEESDGLVGVVVGGVAGSDGVVVGSDGVVVGGGSVGVVIGSDGVVDGGVTGFGALSFTIV